MVPESILFRFSLDGPVLKIIPRPGYYRRSTSMMSDGSGPVTMEPLVEGTGKQKRVWNLFILCQTFTFILLVGFVPSIYRSKLSLLKMLHAYRRTVWTTSIDVLGNINFLVYLPFPEFFHPYYIDEPQLQGNDIGGGVVACREKAAAWGTSKAAVSRRRSVCEPFIYYDWGW